jgi:hypothetical protein
MFAKQSKCVFAQNQVEYIGHIMTGQGVTTDPEKVRVVQDWSEPKTITELRGFSWLSWLLQKIYKRIWKIL